MLLDEYGVQVSGPLERWASGFASRMASQGYCWLLIRRALLVLAFVSNWLGARRLRPGNVTAEHLARLRQARRGDDNRRALSKVLEFLRAAGAIPPVRPTSERTVLGRLLDRYREHLADERGLSDGVVRWYGTVAGRFLKGCERNADFRRLSAGGVREFLRKEARGFSSGQAGYVATALRSLLRYLHADGRIPTSLVRAVPSISGWRGASLPQAVTAGVVRKLLRGCDRRTLIGRRDHAILLLLVRLGLRAGEVARLELAAFEWRAGEIVVHGKGRPLHDCRSPRMLARRSAPISRAVRTPTPGRCSCEAGRHSDPWARPPSRTWWRKPRGEPGSRG